MANDNGLRIAKFIASRGIASRREAEAIIAAGRISVNGKIIDTPAVFIEPEVDQIKLDGRNLPPTPPMAYYLFYKPRGCITGRRDPEGRKSVFDLVSEKIDQRVEPVGRLDFDTEGALILTNDGVLANTLCRPATKVPRRYLAKVYRTPDAKDIDAIEKGKVFLDDGATAPAKVRVTETTDTQNAWVEITVTEGRNRLIRRMFAQLGHPVSKLRRESFATLSIRGMERGAVRELDPQEVIRIKDIARGIRPKKAGKTGSRKGFAKAKMPKRKRLGKRRDAPRA